MIKIENLNYAYKTGAKNQNQALVDINLEIADNSLTALIGHTGSGKSTLAKHFNAIFPPNLRAAVIVSMFVRTCALSPVVYEFIRKNSGSSDNSLTHSATSGYSSFSIFHTSPPGPLP